MGVFRQTILLILRATLNLLPTEHTLRDRHRFVAFGQHKFQDSIVGHVKIETSSAKTKSFTANNSVAFER